MFCPLTCLSETLKKKVVILRQGADFRLLIGTLRASGIIPSSGDIQVQTENLATQVRLNHP